MIQNQVIKIDNNKIFLEDKEVLLLNNKYYYLNEGAVINSSSSGIYFIVNIVDGKFYIGSATNFQNRKSSHFSCLKNKKHGNPKLQNAFYKHKKENFIFIIVSLIEKPLLKNVEQFYLDKYWDNGENCYNITNVAGRPPTYFGKENHFYGKKHTEESLKKMRGRSISQEQRDHLSECFTSRIVPEEVAEQISRTHKLVAIQKNKNLSLLTESYLYNEYILNKKSKQQIADEAKTSYGAVHNKIKEFNIEIRKQIDALNFYFKKENPNLEKITKQFLIENYCDKKLTIKEVSDLLGVSGPTIVKHLNLNKISLRTTKENKDLINPNLNKITKELLEKEFVFNKKTTKKIAEQYGVSPQTIDRRLVKYKLKIIKTRKTKKSARNLRNSPKIKD